MSETKNPASQLKTQFYVAEDWLKHSYIIFWLWTKFGGNRLKSHKVIHDGLLIQ